MYNNGSYRCLFGSLADNNLIQCWQSTQKDLFWGSFALTVWCSSSAIIIMSMIQWFRSNHVSSIWKAVFITQYYLLHYWWWYLLTWCVCLSTSGGHVWRDLPRVQWQHLQSRLSEGLSEQWWMYVDHPRWSRRHHLTGLHRIPDGQQTRLFGSRGIRSTDNMVRTVLDC